MPEQLLWSVRELNYTVGEQTIFDHAEFGIHAGERLGLVGRNGTGKSTLLRLMTGELAVTGAQVDAARQLRISTLPQDFEGNLTGTVGEAISAGLSDLHAMIREFENLSGHSPRHDELEQKLFMLDAWNADAQVAILAEKLRLGGLDRPCSTLSGGEKRRVALGRTIAARPDLLLLDEPTNHLDVETVQWIEDFLNDYRGSCLFVTHDRYFLDRLATRIVELDRGKFFSYDGAYADFIAGKAAREEAEDALETKRRSFLRSEIEWVRRSPKARLRRNVGRLKHFQEIAAVSAPVRAGTMDLVIPAPERIGNKTVNFEDVSVTLGGKKLLEHFSLELPPACRIGIVGANGAGKTTLLRLLTGEFAPDSGKVETAPAIRFNYIDQGKVKLNLENTVREEIAGGVDHVELGSERVSVWGYLRRFLFEDDRINAQVKYLSGGEKARLTLAKQLKEGGNFLVLDEPTNDLDLSSLRMLEEALNAFPGCLAVVSHDRYFINRVCDQVIVFAGDGEVFVTPGDYDYALAKLRELRAAKAAQSAGNAPVKPAKTPPGAVSKPCAPTKLSFKEQRELDGMEDAITTAESEVADLEKIFASPDFFAAHGADAAALKERFDAAKAKVEALYRRWDELEAKKASFAE